MNEYCDKGERSKLASERGAAKRILRSHVELRHVQDDVFVERVCLESVVERKSAGLLSGVARGWGTLTEDEL